MKGGTAPNIIRRSADPLQFTVGPHMGALKGKAATFGTPPTCVITPYVLDIVQPPSAASATTGTANAPPTVALVKPQTLFSPTTGVGPPNGLPSPPVTNPIRLAPQPYTPPPPDDHEPLGPASPPPALSNQHPPPDHSSSSFIFANIAGLLSETGRVAKIPILTSDCESSNPLFLAFTESHLNESSKEKEYHIPNYSHITSNRVGRNRGGVIIYLQNHLTFKLLASVSDNMCSFLAIHINEIKLVLLLAYRPPAASIDNRYRDLPLELSFNKIILS